MISRRKLMIPLSPFLFLVLCAGLSAIRNGVLAVVFPAALDCKRMAQNIVVLQVEIAGDGGLVTDRRVSFWTGNFLR
jgi:hypothetical protein